MPLKQTNKQTNKQYTELIRIFKYVIRRRTVSFDENFTPHCLPSPRCINGYCDHNVINAISVNEWMDG